MFGILLWSMPGVGAGAGLAAPALSPAPVRTGTLVIPGVLSPTAAIPDMPAIMRRSTGSVITRSRITGSAIMRRWIAMRLESLLIVSDIFALELAASPDALVPGMFIEEWSIVE